MSEPTADQIGKLPRGWIPAAWWYSDDPENLAAYQQWRIDYEARSAELQAFAETVGIADLDEIRVWEGGKRTELRGFKPSTQHRRDGAPEGWRIDSKTGYLVPSRRTKKDRESEANKTFRRLARIPNSLAYMKGMPEHLFVPSGRGSTHMYSPTIWMGTGSVLTAFIGGDPDRSEKRDRFAVDESKWHRLPLSLFHQFRDQQEVNA